LFQAALEAQHRQQRRLFQMNQTSQSLQRLLLF
jgi:hypothetical protein